MTTALAPTARRVQLGVLLRNHRDHVGLETKEVAKALGWYTSKVSRVETGMRTVVPAELDRLLELYRVRPQEAEELRALGTQARKRGPVGPLPQRAQTFVAVESIAEELAYYAEEAIPPPAQTESYARAQVRAALTDYSPMESELLIALRAQRGRRLAQPSGPRVRLVLSEAALRRPVGGPVTFREQLGHLRDLAELPHLSLRILAAASGEHVALGLPFQIARLTGARADFVYLEGLTDGTYLTEEAETRPYLLALDRVQESALPEDESLRMIERYLAELA